MGISVYASKGYNLKKRRKFKRKFEMCSEIGAGRRFDLLEFDKAPLTKVSLKRKMKQFQTRSHQKCNVKPDYSEHIIVQNANFLRKFLFLINPIKNVTRKEKTHKNNMIK